MDLEEGLDLFDCEDWSKGGAVHLYSRRPNSHGGHLSFSRTYQPISNRNQKFITHIRSSPLELHSPPRTQWEGKENMGMPNSVPTDIHASLQVRPSGKAKTSASVEQAFDPRSRMVLFKMLDRGIFNDINGCISTGKNAIVYHATKDDGQEFAVKVYKTSDLTFKSGDRSIQGDYHFRHGYCKHNRRQMVKTWAETEMRNLVRLKAAGIRCPTPIFLRLHVLVMEFIGQSGRAAPSLKDANLSEDKMSESYIQMIMTMRNLYQNCKLVHGDLTECNTLYHEGNLHIINVSQSVDIDHPLALNFLRRDCNRVSVFFERNGVGVMAIHKLFDFIVDSSITDKSVGCYLEEVQRETLARRAVRFRMISVKPGIPSTPDQAKDAEFANWFTSDTVSWRHVIEHSFSTAQKQVAKQPNELDINDTSTKQTNNLGTETDEDDKEDNDSEGVDQCNTTMYGTQEMLPDKKTARKENKKKVKEEKREARKAKTPKAVRKKKKKLAKNIRAK